MSALHHLGATLADAGDMNAELQRALPDLSVPGPSAEWVSAGATAVTALVALAALWFAWQQIGEAKAARALTRSLETARSQPYVVVYAEESPATPVAIDLVVRNFGPTAAERVQIELDPWPRRSDSDVRNEEPVGIPEFPVLAPGQEWRTSWVWTPDYAETDLPRRHEGRATYTGVEGAELSTPIVLDLRVYMERIWVEVRGMHDAATALREINKTVKRWTDGNALNVLTRDGAARDTARAEHLERILAAREKRRIHQEQEAAALRPEEEEPKQPS